MISDIVSLRDSGKYQGIIGAVFGLSSVVGPLVGGLFTDFISWRWCFYVNLPIGFVTVTAVALFLKFPAPEGSIRNKLKQLDILGTVLIISATSCLLIPLQLGGSTWAWNSAEAISLFCISGALFFTFGFIERYYAYNPIVITIT